MAIKRVVVRETIIEFSERSEAAVQFGRGVPPKREGMATNSDDQGPGRPDTLWTWATTRPTGFSSWPLLGLALGVVTTAIAAQYIPTWLKFALLIVAAVAVVGTLVSVLFYRLSPVEKVGLSAVLCIPVLSFSSGPLHVWASINAPTSQARTDDMLAYVEAKGMATHAPTPNQGPQVIYLPDFDAAAEIGQMFPRSTSVPWASRPVYLSLKLTNEGARPWRYYVLPIAIFYEYDAEATPLDRDWSSIKHVTDSLTISNCNHGSFMCEGSPLSAAGGSISFEIFNLSGVVAALQFPDTINVSLSDGGPLSPVPVDIGGDILKGCRCVLLEPNRNGQGNYVR